MATVEHGALVGIATGRGNRFSPALDEVLSELGFRPGGTAKLTRWPRETENDRNIELSYLEVERGGWACVGTSPPMARAIATRLAARLTNPVQLFTATARFTDSSLACTVEDRIVRSDGASAVGAFARELEASVGGDWRELCDHKMYFAMGSLLDAAIEHWITMPFERRDVLWSGPPSLGDRRLDEVAMRIRTATSAQLGTLDGRTCVRVKAADGATATSFLTDDELARLEPFVAGLLTKS